MRKLKLHMQISLDGFVAGPEGQLDWMTWNQDDKLKQFTNELTDSCDTILMGRKMTDGFTTHWENIVDTNQITPGSHLQKKWSIIQKLYLVKRLQVL